MSWLLAASVPGFLILSTVGLQRLESGLAGEVPSAAQLVGRLEKAAWAAREQQAARREAVPGFLADEPGLPTRPNPRVRPSEIANPV